MIVIGDVRAVVMEVLFIDVIDVFVIVVVNVIVGDFVWVGLDIVNDVFVWKVKVVVDDCNDNCIVIYCKAVLFEGLYFW